MWAFGMITMESGILALVLGIVWPHWSPPLVRCRPVLSSPHCAWISPEDMLTLQPQHLALKRMLTLKRTWGQLPMLEGVPGPLTSFSRWQWREGWPRTYYLWTDHLLLGIRTTGPACWAKVILLELRAQESLRITFILLFPFSSFKALHFGLNKWQGPFRCRYQINFALVLLPC